MTDDSGSTDDEQTPWWHTPPGTPPADSLLVEGMKLYSVLRNWAVETGVAGAAVDMAQNAASNASAFLAEVAAVEPEVDQTPTHIRCDDCPVCRGLDALERSNPEMADTARVALLQISGVIAGLIGALNDQEPENPSEETEY